MFVIVSCFLYVLDSPRMADLGLLDFYIKGGGPPRKGKHHFLAKELKSTGTYTYILYI